jgi:hypothetical protein
MSQTFCKKVEEENPFYLSFFSFDLFYRVFFAVSLYDELKNTIKIFSKIKPKNLKQ